MAKTIIYRIGKDMAKTIIYRIGKDMAKTIFDYSWLLGMPPAVAPVKIICRSYDETNKFSTGSIAQRLFSQKLVPWISVKSPY